MALNFLTETGQTCTPLRQEFILLSDIFGWSALVDSMNHPIPADSNATEATVLGPFFVEDAEDVDENRTERSKDLLSIELGRYQRANPSRPRVKVNICTYREL